MDAKQFRDLDLDDEAMKRIKFVQDFLGEQPDYLIESQKLGVDGPYTASVFLITSWQLAEIHLMSQGIKFDVIDKTYTYNYRIEIEKHTIKEESTEEGVENQPETIDMCSIQLLHTSGTGFRSDLSYFGDDIHKWLEFVKEALPIEIVKVGAVHK